MSSAGAQRFIFPLCRLHLYLTELLQHSYWGLLLLTSIVLLSTSIPNIAGADDHFHQPDSSLSHLIPVLSSVAAGVDSRCQIVPAHILSKVNLTKEESSLLSSVCWHEDTQMKHHKLLKGLDKRSGVPAGVQCNKTAWWVIAGQWACYSIPREHP